MGLKVVIRIVDKPELIDRAVFESDESATALRP